ncbi:protein NEGATIVE GRAVITROPIC RESPONSE OF ROOTS-like [Benincasa hispida]|uniref:protein NEGATIVE GRAVITROPIC RESPONSE OF ROOTS-like n=1 Tax=Benincasa hispida TaxID=102211 RepID=UPI001902BD29|nr:protein NEGATIVE GRAVITROPIC RESPONSE OF ROOTS-like [Benincasa hispida]
MKLLSWMQSKLQGKVKFQNKGSHSNSSIEQLEETSPLPLGLLAIGTFGNNNVLNVLKTTDAENTVVDARSPSKETEDEGGSLEDIPKLEEELRELWQQNTQLGEEETDDFDNDQTEEQGVKKNIGNLVIGEWKDDDEKSNHPKSIVKRSVSFLVKKIFVCGSGFAPLPPLPPLSFMDTPQDATMKKILRMMLRKKIYPKNSSQMASLKRFIKEKERRDKRSEDEENKYDNCNNVNSRSKSIQ